MYRYLIFATVGLSLLLIAISNTAVSVAFPVIASYFETNLVVAGWVLSIQQLAITVTMPLAGKICDVFGRKRTFLVCLVLFGTGSILAGTAENIFLLILFRLMQGIGGGGFVPAASGIVAAAFPQERQRMLGFFSAIFPLGEVIGPNLGGILVESFGWRSVFWFNIPLVIAIFIASLVLMKRSTREKGHIDLVGAGLIAGALSSLMTGLAGLRSTGSSSSPTSSLPLFVAAAVFLVLFARHAVKAKEPIVDLQVLRERRFLAANIYNLFLGAAMFALIGLTPLYAVSVYGLSVLQSGLIVTPRSIGMMAASMLTSLFLTRWGYRKPILIGTTVMVLSMVALSLEPKQVDIAGTHLSGVAVLVLIQLALGVAMGTAIPAANNACMDLMPERIAMIAGVRGMFRQSGGAISISVTSLLLNNLQDIQSGFAIAFAGLAALLLLATPLAFIIPAAPLACPDTRE